jgi:N-acetylneuraminate synthase|tara:strand:+ start:2496 stop:4406 length:1911 start_codon:yes stop_codon:yes gene_type:complete
MKDSSVHFKIGDHEICDSKVYIIAEIGNNHNGSYERAIEMIDLAVDAGADAVKFQMRNLDEVYRKRSLGKAGEDLGTEYIVDLLNRFELSKEEHQHLSEYCKTINIPYLCTPWDICSVDILEDFNVPAYKVASADLTNTPLLEKLITTNKPLILSTGMSTNDEVQIAANFLNEHDANFIFLHCNSTYPAPIQDINLSWINQLRKIHPLVGYSGHERGINISIAAAAFNILVLERHFTLDRSMEGPDHAASLDFKEFKALVEGIREIEKAIGHETESRQQSQGEMINRENLSKSLVAVGNLKSGLMLEPQHIKVRSPGQGLSPQKYNELLGKTLQHDMSDEDFFYESDLKQHRIEPKEYLFTRPWGIPVRFHDFKTYNDKINPNIWEFHLSYSDMDLIPGDYINSKSEAGFVVHAPELFSGSHLMDLATSDDDYRNESIKETQRVINLTRDLNKYFPNTEKPMIVTNIGGFSMDEPLPKTVLPSYYENFANSLQALDTTDVEIIPQTMAPFPWHFGGQRFQNMFVHADEILFWCEQLNLRMCLDVSHSQLTCNHFGLDFYDFCSKVGSVSAHLHLGDASGVNGEGLQIDEGDIDFKRLGEILNTTCPNASFIPEIWQGHKNGGEDFWIALEKLESKI